MKRILVGLLLSVFTSFTIITPGFAQQVEQSEAETVAEKWYRHKTGDFVNEIPFDGLDIVKKNGTAII